MTNSNLASKEQRNDVADREVTRDVYFTPRVDILETEDALELFADMPGVKPQDVDIRFENGELTLHGKCAPRHNVVNYLHGEYGVGDFYRTFSVAQDVDTDKITAEIKGGVLKVTLPKSEAVKPKRITVKGE